MANMRPEPPGSDHDALGAAEVPPGGDGETRRLYRSADQRILLGVCGGLGEYFDVDPTLVRIVFIILTLAGLSGLLLYVVLAAIMPAEDRLDAHPRDAARATLDEAVDSTKQAAERAKNWVSSLTGGRRDSNGNVPPPA